MAFANPWGLLGLLSLPIIVGIHMFHRRFPRLEIAGSHLWDLDAQTVTPGRRRERLPITRSLLFELLAAFVLSMILAQPQVTHLTTATHLVVILDDSASMSATLSDGRTIRDHCVEQLEQRIDQLGRNVVVTLVLTGRRTENLSGTAVPWNEARERLELWQPGSPDHDPGSAWDIGAQLAGDSGQLLFLTNRMPAEDVNLPDLMEVLSIGEPMNNGSIELARWTVDSRTGEGQLYVRLRNHGIQSCQATLIGRSAEKIVVDQTVQLPPRDSKPLEIPVGQGIRRLQLELVVADDPLNLDNQVILIEPRQRRVRVAVNLDTASPAYRFVDRVLSVLAGVDRVDSGTADLVIDSATRRPGSNRELWWLGIGPLRESATAQEAAEDLAAPFLVDSQSMLLDGLVLGGIVWGGAQPVDDELIPLVSADRLPLIGRLQGTLTNAFLMNIDLARSNLPDSPDWPVLLANLVEMCRADRPGLKRWNYRLNESFQFRMANRGDTNEPFRLVRGDDERLLSWDRNDVIEVNGIDVPGEYELRRGETVWDRFSVNFYDPLQSDLTRLQAGERLPLADDQQPFRLENAYTWLMLAGVLIVLLVTLKNWSELRSSRT